MSLGENIYTLRKKQKLSQEQLAEKINVTRQTISNWELGETSPNPEQLIKISGVFGISIDELVGNDTYYMGINSATDTEAAQTASNEKSGAPKGTESGINHRIPFVISLVSAALWAVIAIIFFAGGNEILGILDVIICFIWVAVAIIQYKRFIKKNPN